MTDRSRELLCAALRDAAFRWPELDDTAARALYSFAREQGVHLLLASLTSSQRNYPPPLRERVLTALHQQAAVEEKARHELRSVLTSLHERGILAVLFKGTALAYTHYDDPILRPRFDTDVLIDSREIETARQALEQHGYRSPPFSSGDLVMHQAPFHRIDDRGVPHAIDVHWRISNPQVFSTALTVEELRAQAPRIPLLGNGAWAAAPVHALALACIHRVAHHSADERLIWLYDIHLLAEGFSRSDEDQFVDLAHAKALRAVCAAGLHAARHCFDGRGVSSLLARIEGDVRGEREKSEIYVTRKMRKVDVLMSDLRALHGWGPKIKLVREHVLPPTDYMRATYGVSSSALLPLLYVWRFARGATAWLRR